MYTNALQCIYRPNISSGKLSTLDFISTLDLNQVYT